MRQRHAVASAAAARQGGFSLIEIMIVIVILGMLAAVLVPRIMDRPDEARVTKAQMDIRVLEAAVRYYKLDNTRYPTTEQGLEALVAEPTAPPPPKNWRQGGYLEASEAPKDPWGNDYVYRSPGEEHDFIIISYGADGEEGGEGFDADITNWNIK